MNEIMSRKLNEVLNLKEVRCLGCDRLIEFKSLNKVGENPYIAGLKEFSCDCGKTDNLKGVAYVKFKDSERCRDKDLLEFLEEEGVLPECHTDDVDELYRRLDSADKKLLGRKIKDESNDGLEEKQTKFMTRELDDITIKSMLAAYKKINMERPGGYSSKEWDLEDILYVGSYRVCLNISKDNTILAIELQRDGEVLHASFFDVKCVTRMLNDEEDLARMFITRGYMIGKVIEEYENGKADFYKMPPVDITRLAESVCGQVRESIEPILFGQEACKASDWVVSDAVKDVFNLRNSAGDNLEFELIEESENFIYVSVALKKKEEEGSYHSSYFIEKSDYSLMKNVVNELDYICTLDKAVDSIEKITLEKHPYLRAVYELLSEDKNNAMAQIENRFNDDEVAQLKDLRNGRMKLFESEDKVGSNRNDTPLDEEIKKFLEISNAEELIGMVQASYYCYEDEFEGELGVLNEEMERILHKLVSEYGESETIEAVKGKCDKEYVEYISCLIRSMLE